MLSLIGQRFGRWTVVARSPKTASTRSGWTCRCDCGTERLLDTAKLTSGRSTSCGCSVVKHGKYKTATYHAWTGLKQRCTNPNVANYADYGGRGIAVCAGWLESFENFLADVGERPSAAHSIDRFPDVNGNYEPGNVRWATASQQTRNRRGVLSESDVLEVHGRIEHGESHSAVARRFDIHPSNVTAIRSGRSWKELR